MENKRPARILVVDTNLLMNDPDPSNWSVKLDGQSLFVVPDSIFHELEFIRQRRDSREKTDSQDKANIAIKIMAGLFKQGIIAEGIPIKGGWIIGVPSPKQDDLDQELRQYEDIVKAFGRYDTKLLLLTRECSLLLQPAPVILLTGEVNLFNVAETNGIVCHLCTGFPIEGLRIASQPVDWDNVLEEIQVATKQNSIVVETTLTNLKSSPKSLIIAEGHGTMYDGKKHRSFLWTISFYPRNMISNPIKYTDNKATDFPSIHLEFLGEDDFDQNLFDGIADRLLDCANISFEEDKPTLQNPESVMETLVFYEYLAKNIESNTNGTFDQLWHEIEESEGLIHYWTDWILGKEDEDDRTACLESFLQGLKNCWKLGQTYKFSFIPSK